MKRNKHIHKPTGEKHTTSIRVLRRNGDVHERVIENGQLMMGSVVDYTSTAWELFIDYSEADYLEVRFDGRKYEPTGKWYKVVYDDNKSARLVSQV